MDLADLMNQQYEEVDSKEEVKEEKIDVNEILRANEITEKWLDEEREYRENSKSSSHSTSAFTRKEVKSKFKKEEKEEKKTASSAYSYTSRYSYSSSSSTTETKKSSDEAFYDKVEKAFNEKVNKMVEDVINKELNQIQNDCQWDILDLQYELNKKRISERYYEEEPEAKEFERKMEKYSNSCARKVDIAEILMLLKINPNG